MLVLFLSLGFSSDLLGNFSADVLGYLAADRPIKLYLIRII